MFSKSIKDFTENMQMLREFVAIIKPVLQEKTIQTAKSQPEALMLIALGSAMSGRRLAEDQDEDIIDEEVMSKLLDNYGISIIQDDENDEMSFVQSEENASSFRMLQGIHNIHKSCQQESHLYGSSLISLTSVVEWFLSEILHSYYVKYPDSFNSSDKTFSLSDLKGLASIQDVEQYFLDKKIEEILRGSIDDWIRYLRSNLKLNMSYLDTYMKELSEIFHRRNLLVHNHGLVNRIYIAKVDESQRLGARLDKPISVTDSYLQHAIDLIERMLTLIALELWKNCAPDDAIRGEILVEIVFDHLVNQRWSISESLCRFMINDSKIPEINKLVGQINYWLSVKEQGRYQEIQKEIESADYSAKAPIFQLALAAIKVEPQEFFHILPTVISAEGLTYAALDSWPIFREIRQTESYIDYRQAHENEFNASILDEEKALCGIDGKSEVASLAESVSGDLGIDNGVSGDIEATVEDQE